MTVDPHGLTVGLAAVAPIGHAVSSARIHVLTAQGNSALAGNRRALTSAAPHWPAAYWNRPGLHADAVAGTLRAELWWPGVPNG